MKRFLDNPVVVVGGTEVRFAYRGTTSMMVRIYGCPVEVSHAELRQTLEGYGPVESVTHEWVPEFDGIPSGTRRAKMEMKRALPNFIQVAEFSCQCEYVGVAHVCSRCGSSDHVRAACGVPLCSRCGEFGHAECSKPCPQCGGDHSIARCEKRTFASVAKRALAVAAASAAVVKANQVSEEQPSETAEEGATTSASNPAVPEEQLQAAVASIATSPATNDMDTTLPADDDGFTRVVRKRKSRKEPRAASSTTSSATSRTAPIAKRRNAGQRSSSSSSDSSPASPTSRDKPHSERLEYAADGVGPCLSYDSSSDSSSDVESVTDGAQAP